MALPPPLQAHVGGVGVLSSEYGTCYPGHSHSEHRFPFVVVVGPGMVVSSKGVTLNFKTFMRWRKKKKVRSSEWNPGDEKQNCCWHLVTGLGQRAETNIV